MLLLRNYSLQMSFFEFNKNNWLFKYKIYHLPFWALYHYIWWAWYEGSTLTAFNSLLDPPSTVKFLFYVVFQTLGVYFCLYYLIPRFLEKRKYVLFLSMLGLDIIAMSLVIMAGYFISASIFGYDVYDLFGFVDRSPIYILKTQAIPSSITAMAMGMSIKLAKNYLGAQKKQQVLEKEKLETELKFLKSQFNPHFLFNSINSIFVLINKNQKLATDSLAKFSELLRYQLYECNEPEIPLNRELNYLKSFIELEKLRQNKNCELQMNIFNKEESTSVIAPFLLMPFIENAFKHVSKESNKVNWIEIEISIKSNQFRFRVKNSVSNEERSREQLSYGGLGLTNVKRRLDLLYFKNYDLKILETENFYEISLELMLKENTYKTNLSINSND